WTPGGRLWVSAVSGRVQQFTPDGVYLRGVGGESGDGPGQFRAPHGVAADGRGHLYVVDSYNHRVQKFAVGPWRPSPWQENARVLCLTATPDAGDLRWGAGCWPRSPASRSWGWCRRPGLPTRVCPSRPGSGPRTGAGIGTSRPSPWGRRGSSTTST